MLHLKQLKSSKFNLIYNFNMIIQMIVIDNPNVKLICTKPIYRSKSV